jgi:hypothetical protein
MMIALDAMSERYKQLPSALLESGTTFDLRVFDVGAAWNRHQYEKHTQTPEQGRQKRAQTLTVDQMQAMVQRTRKQNDQRKTNSAG